MCDLNHDITPIMSIATPELATRALAYFEELELSTEQIQNILQKVKRWREQYIQFAEQIVHIGQEIDRELLKRHVDLTKVEQLIERRLEVIKAVEREFIRTWIDLRESMDEEQYERLQAVYRREFMNLPHPILGSAAKEASLAS